MNDVLIENADVGGTRTGVRIRDGRIHALGPKLVAEPGEARIPADGGALLPGLHDHHIHLFALAAAGHSLECGPPALHNEAQLREALGAAAHRARQAGDTQAWVRGIGYHESVAGPLDRHRLDALMGASPVRVQHRSGALWILNSAAIARLKIDASGPLPSGVERGPDGQPTGRLHRVDGWLRERLGVAAPPRLDAVGRALARLGVTGLCDATANNGPDELAHINAAAASGDLPQRIRVMGGLALPLPRHPRIQRGALKVMLDENDLPPESELVETIGAAHAQGRGVAFHCVTRAELVVAAAGLEKAGSSARDRIEHASLAPPDAVDWLARLGVSVVTQPNFLHERGDRYRREVHPRDQPWLYRGRGFIEAGVPLGAGTDAPFGACDPWAAMRAAVQRLSRDGAPMQPEEALGPEAALALFTSALASPGQPRGPLGRGQPADLILLDRPWRAARERLDPRDLRATLIGGETVWRRDPRP